MLTHLLSSGHELALHGDSHLDPGQPRNWLDHVKRRVYTDGEGEFADLSTSHASWWWRRQPLVRLELHPRDADHPDIRRMWVGELATLMHERRPLTLADAVNELWQPAPGRGVCQGAGPDWPDTTIDFTRTSHADRASQMVQR